MTFSILKFHLVNEGSISKVSLIRKYNFRVPFLIYRGNKFWNKKKRSLSSLPYWAERVVMYYIKWAYSLNYLFDYSHSKLIRLLSVVLYIVALNLQLGFTYFNFPSLTCTHSRHDHFICIAVAFEPVPCRAATDSPAIIIVNIIFSVTFTSYLHPSYFIDLFFYSSLVVCKILIDFWNPAQRSGYQKYCTKSKHQHFSN